MIRTITDLKNNIFCKHSDIQDLPPKDPSIGDIYYDTNKNKIFYFKNSWVELNVYHKNVEFNKFRKFRKRKINKIFNELL